MARGISAGVGEGILLASPLSSAQAKATWSLWIYGNSWTSAYSGGWSHGGGVNDLLIKSTGGYAMYGGWVAGDPMSATTLSTGRWYHMLMTGGVGLGGKFYVNGLQDAAYGGGLGPIGLSGTVALGYDKVSAGRVLNGRLADFAIWNDFLSAAEVFALSKGINPTLIRPSKLRAYYPLNDASGRVRDFSCNSGVGTATSSITLAPNPPLLTQPTRFAQPINVPLHIAAGGFKSRYYYDMNRSQHA